MPDLQHFTLGNGTDAKGTHGTVRGAKRETCKALMKQPRFLPLEKGGKKGVPEEKVHHVCEVFH